MEVMVAGVPNIMGSFSFLTPIKPSTMEAFFVANEYEGTSVFGNSYRGNSYDLGLQASKDNSIYGASDTVQPPAIQLIPQLRY